MKILVSGANGFVGTSLCAELIGRNHDVRAAVRSANLLMQNISEVSVGQIDGETNWAEALQGVDVVIHLAARVHVLNETAENPSKEFCKINIEGTENLAKQAVRAGVKRLVYVSTIGVNGLSTQLDASFSEADTPHPHNAYARSKWAAEQILHTISKETGLETVIVRPPLVYGVGAPGNFAQMLKVLRKRIPLPLASMNNLRSFIYVENLVDALILCATHPEAAGHTYLICDGEDVSTPQLLRQLGAAMGRPAHLFQCSPALLKLAGQLTGKSDQIERLSGSLRVDNGKIRRELGWQPPYTLQEGLRKTIELNRKIDERK
jgi:nucleoside-diphosphate-sugar epimerase